LGISREAVSNWLSGDAVPRPRHRALLAALLGVSVSALANGPGQVSEPIVAFRVKGRRKVGDEQRAWIKRDVVWLSALEMRMKDDPWLERLPEHRLTPTTEEARQVARKFRSDIGMGVQDDVIMGHRLISWMSERGVCIVPVFWGKKEHPLNAMYVRLPASEVHWMYVNLDASIIDVRFWLLHELAHMIRRRPHDADAMEENFADAFAAQVLFPLEQANDFVDIITGLDTREQVSTINRLANARGISSITVYRQLNTALASRGQNCLDLDGIIYPAALRMSNDFSTWADGLFGGQIPGGLKFITTSTERLGTPVFELAAREIMENNRGHGFVERVFQCGAADALSLYAGLREYGAAKDTA
jgi:Zn-dependent peptidase ImmA (M78 family)/transcriptional regulator with XRE-family HTH domain